MNGDNSNPNLEWKKGSIGIKEKITLKTNVAKAVEYDAQKQNLQKPVLHPSPKDLPKGLKRIRKKIKDVFDEEDEDESEYITLQDTALLEQDHNSLLNALNENEKKQLQQQETLHQNKMQQDAGKLEAMLQAEKIIKEAGLPRIDAKTKAKNMQDVRINTDTVGNVIRDVAPKKLNLSPKKMQKLSLEEKKKLAQGISLVKQLGGEKALTGTKVEELVFVGDKKSSEKEVAKIILEKTGRKKAKAPSKKKQQTAQKELEKQVVNTRKKTRERSY